MPRRSDIHKILVIGSGPIIIGQGCEFDYSGTQAVKALREEGYEVVLVNSNPATIMTDPEMAEATYVEPLVAEIVEKIIERERPDALLPTVGGQTALNLAVELSASGVLARFGVELIGARVEALRLGEDRQLFKAAMEEVGLPVLRSGMASDLEQAFKVKATLGYPVILRPSFTLGGTGGGTAYNDEEFESMVTRGLALSPTHELLIEESVIGWKEFELEVMRDLNDNVVVICSIENFDPMGVHTGDSITVAPAQTLTDKEYQRLRDMSRQVIRRVGVETGGSNIQFAVNPKDGRVAVIEMNPRVSRSSALASKATGFPIAKIAAKLAVGLTLDEIANDITKKTPACFEPSIDYVVVKIPRWAFEKFPAADPVLGTQMKSVGEAMAIGATFKEALQKGLRSLELRLSGFVGKPGSTLSAVQILERVRIPTWDRILLIRDGLKLGLSVESMAEATGIDPWFLRQLQQIVQFEEGLEDQSLAAVAPEVLRAAKRLGFSDVQLARSFATPAADVRRRRLELGIRPAYRMVDTCAAEFESQTPYLYSTYESDDEATPSAAPKVMILGGGPNRIGQGIEFDYCCCHASFALKAAGYESIMVNCNPETVSTDYDTSSRLYFEPLTVEDVLNIVDAEKPTGVIVQFGGQTPLSMAVALKRAGVPILGTDPDDIDLAEDRERFSGLLTRLDIPQPRHGHALNFAEARVVAERIGYPVLVRPSYVLGGRAMTIVYDAEKLEQTMAAALEASPEHPVLIDQFLEDAFEIDVDCVADGKDVVVAGIMQHIEEAGIHSGDSACVLPPYRVGPTQQDIIRDYTRKLALALNVRGLMNVQYAIKDGVVYVLEVNPRASRTVPFVSKATGVAWAKVATEVMVGKSLAELGITAELPVPGYFVKAVVFPFNKFPGVDTLLGPEMRSTGEVMGVSSSFGNAFAKAMLAAGQRLPVAGTAFISVNSYDKPAVVPIAEGLTEMGFRLLATRGTAEFLAKAGVKVDAVNKVTEGRPNVVDLIKDRKIALVINTPLGRSSHYDEGSIRKAATQHGVVCITTLSGASAAVDAIRALRAETLSVKSLQEYHSGA